MSIAATPELKQALTTYLPEMTDEHRRDVVATGLSSHIRQREELFGGDDARREYAAELLSAFIDHPSHQSTPPYPCDVDEDPRFAGWIRTLVSTWTAEERQHIEVSQVLDDTEVFLNSYVEQLVALASETLVRTLVELLSERRGADALVGDSAEARFRHFRAWLGSPDGAQFLANRYPAAVIRAHSLVARRTRCVREILDRFGRDLPELAQRLPGLRDTSQIRAIHLGSGDTHAGGRTVATIELTCDSCVVYKPRTLAIDRALETFALELNRVVGTSLRVPAAVDYGGYGWAEFIYSADAETDTSDYPFRLGELAAVQTVLQSSDMHYENIVTDRLGRPIVVDAETIMTPLIATTQTYAQGAGSVTAQTFIENSVAGLGLLPMKVSVPGREGALDIGASGNQTAERRSPFRSLVVKNMGRDDMYIALETGQATVKNNNPVPTGHLHTVLNYRDAVRNGLETTLRKIMVNRSSIRHLLAESFRGVRVRHVNIPTIFYAQLLRMCSSPKLLEKPADHVAVLARVALQNRGRQSAAQYEVDQLLNDDVPLFTASVEGTDLLDAGGRPLISHFFDTSALQRALDRMDGLNDEEICRQAEMVNLAFVPELPDGGERTSSERIAEHSGLSDSASEHEVRQAVNQVLRRWIPATDPAHPGTFWGPLVTTSDSQQWVPGSLGYDLYGGSLGIALVLAESANLHDNHQAAQVASAVTGPIKEQLLRGAMRGQQLSIGAMTGMGGTIWAISVCDRLLDTARPGEAARLIAELTHQVQPHSPAEFTTGAAGALAAACSVVTHAGPDRPDALQALNELAVKALPLLEREALRMPATSSGSVAKDHHNSAGSFPVFTGFAHGLAGMIGPAAHAARLLRPDAPAVARKLMSFADTLVETLLDQISPKGQIPRAIGPGEASWAWCHGAPGVLLGLVTAAHHGAVVPEKVLNSLQRQSQDRGVGNNPTYCHGDLGTLEALTAWARYTGNTEAEGYWSAEMRARAAGSATRAHSLAADKYAATDSLMVGRAGSLHALLRSSAPATYPDVLTLGEAP